MIISIQKNENTEARNKRRIVIIGCSAFLAMFVIVVTKLFNAGSTSYRGAAIGAGHFLQAIENHDYRSAFKLLDTDQQSKEPINALANLNRDFEKERGRAIRHEGPQNWQIINVNGKTYIRLLYMEHFQHGQSPVQVVMLKDVGVWRVQGFSYPL